MLSYEKLHVSFFQVEKSLRELFEKNKLSWFSNDFSLLFLIQTWCGNHSQISGLNSKKNFWVPLFFSLNTLFTTPYVFYPSHVICESALFLNEIFWCLHKWKRVSNTAFIKTLVTRNFQRNKVLDWSTTNALYSLFYALMQHCFMPQHSFLQV